MEKRHKSFSVFELSVLQTRLLYHYFICSIPIKGKSIDINFMINLSLHNVKFEKGKKLKRITLLWLLYNRYLTSRQPWQSSIAHLPHDTKTQSIPLSTSSPLQCINYMYMHLTFISQSIYCEII